MAIQPCMEWILIKKNQKIFKIWNKLFLLDAHILILLNTQIYICSQGFIYLVHILNFLKTDIYPLHPQKK